ncbi:MAG: lamin tail domain-containing protein [Streptomyces sp.]|uniref:lamin tail domain-containing protein n=1 Tax=Streptomyces sp. TaxID=1931 RepID=UPI003451B157|nr:lamin tail domain-containing protein [Streptomyces sp.]
MSVSVSATARRLGSAAAVAAALVGVTALPAAATVARPAVPHRDAVVISAVQHDLQGRAVFSGRALNREWVDVTNTSRREVNLSGWSLSDADGNRYTFRHYRLAGGTTVRVHTGEGRDTRTDLYQDRRSSVWNRDADTATLRNDRGRYVDSASWGLHHRRDADERHAFADRPGDERHGFADRPGDERHGFADRPGDERHGFAHRPGDERHGFAHRPGDERHGFAHPAVEDRHGFSHRR